MYNEDNDFNDPNFDYYMRQFIPRDKDQREFVICLVVMPVLIFLTALFGTL